MKRILLVDDDPNILASYKRYYGRRFNLETAQGGEEGLALLESDGPFAVVVSDLRMPAMDGIEFLSRVKTTSENSVRVLLTGQAGMNDAIEVINKGQIFRFLTKPCPPEAFESTLRDALEQYRLITAEKELLNKTLKGTIRLLLDILSVLSPDTGSRALRIRRLADKIGARMNVREMWQLEVAALLCQIGCVTIPQEILVKKSLGQTLKPEEREAFVEHIKVGSELVGNIPRLEEIAKAIAYQEKNFDGTGFPRDDVRGRRIPLIARILKVLIDYEDLAASGKSAQDILNDVQSREGRYDPTVLAALEAEILNIDEGCVICQTRTEDVKIGMVLADDLRTKTNILLLAKGQEISSALKVCIDNFAKNHNLVEPIKVLKKITAETDGQETCESKIFLENIT